MKPKISFEEINQIHDEWVNNNPVGTQTELFKKHGWTRTAYFNESYYRNNPSEPPVLNEEVEIVIRKNKL